MKKSLFFLAIMFFSLGSKAQEKKFDIEIHGYVGVDVLNDSRASRTARLRHIYLYPLNRSLNPSGEDLNKRGEFDLDAAHSRLSVHVKGPTVKGISTMAMIEGDFSGGPIGSDAVLQLRHAYMQFGYSDIAFTAGQTWHPFFIPENFPQTLSAGAGVPFHPLSRNPQLRFTWKPNEKIELSTAIIEQALFRSSGFAKGTEESGQPELTFQVKAGGTGAVWASFTAGFKKLAVPTTIASYETPVTINSSHYSGSVRFKTKIATIRSGIVYGGNLTEHVMPGGVGRVTASSGPKPEFKPIITQSLWFDISSTGKTWDPGFFAGYLTNLGASENVTVVNELGRDLQVGEVWAISPRIRYLLGSHVWVGVEYLYTNAGWGTSYNAKGKPENMDNFVNQRAMLSFRYTF